MGVGAGGLTAEQAEKAAGEFGPNDLSRRKEKGVFGEILHRCRNPLVIQLLIICIVSFSMGDLRSAVVVSMSSSDLRRTSSRIACSTIAFATPNLAPARPTYRDARQALNRKPNSGSLSCWLGLFPRIQFSRSGRLERRERGDFAKNA